MAEDLEAAGTTMEANLVDHITEMVIMTALDKTAVAALIAEEAVAAAGPLKMDKEWNEVAILDVVEAETMASLAIPVGRNRHVVNETTAEAVVADLVIENRGITDGMTVGQLPLTIGPLRCREMNGLRANYSREAMDHPESISTAMRISRWKQPDLMCLTALKT